ncbi:MAG: DUF402 domain-containing protein [Firmicutes bacterium]|nr:DUF402 domain-containing protein [Bacillota bacterium]
MRKPAIYRKRYIPLETVDISGDELIFRDDEILITRWDPIRPRDDFARGVSFTFLKEGCKISRHYDQSGKFLYWYCDIIEVEYLASADAYTLVDLLLDVRVMADGTWMVFDAGELADALEQRLIDNRQACSALRRLDYLLDLIGRGEFPPAACRQEEYWAL